MTATPTPVVERVVITAETTVDETTADVLWDLYRASFEALRTRAAARHLLTRQEFALEVLDRRVTKYLARTPRGQVMGLCTLSNDLDTVPWISPEFYRTRYPVQFARRALFYCGIALVDPAARSTQVLPDLMTAIGGDIARVDGVIAVDMCRFNVEQVHLARTVTMMMGRVWGSGRAVELDRQLYLAWEPERGEASP